MQIPQNVINMLSAKGKGYVEAALKIAEGQRLLDEGTNEIATLDGKRILKGGGVDVLPIVRDLARRSVSPEYLKTLLARGPLNSREIATQAGCSAKHAHSVLTSMTGVHVTGTGNRVKWEITPAASRITKRPKVANRTLRASKGRKPRDWKPANTIKAEDRFDDVKRAIVGGKTWASKRVISRVTGISRLPLDRILAAMVRGGILVTKVKKHNPSHKQPKNYERAMTYWELA